MSNYNVKVVVLTPVVDNVPVADVAVSYRITLSLAGAVIATQDVAMATPEIEANFTVTEGEYDGTGQSVRADGSLIDAPTVFKAIAAPVVVSAPVPSGVSVTVTPA